MTRPDYIPADYKRIKVVSSLTDLFSSQFGGADDVNCILYPRRLSGDFNALANVLETKAGGRDLDYLSSADEEFREERRIITGDIDLVKDEMIKIGLEPHIITQDSVGLRVRRYYEWDDQFSPYAFHSDSSAHREFGRVVCCYTDPVTEWTKNEYVTRVDANLYQLEDGAPVYSFKAGDIWRQYSPSLPLSAWALDQENPFIHRTPEKVKHRKPGDPLRLMLVAG